MSEFQELSQRVRIALRDLGIESTEAFRVAFSDTSTWLVFGRAPNIGRASVDELARFAAAIGGVPDPERRAQSSVSDIPADDPGLRAAAVEITRLLGWRAGDDGLPPSPGWRGRAIREARKVVHAYLSADRSGK